MRFPRVFVLFLVAAAMVSPTVLAQDESKFKVSLAFVNVAPTAKDGFFGFEAQSGTGGEVAFEYYASEKMGIELAAGTASHDIEDSFGFVTSPGMNIAEISQIPVFLNLNFHLVNSEKVDFWLGGGLSMAMWDDLEIEPSLLAPGDPSEIGTQTDYGLSVNGGVDIRIGKRFAVLLGVRYYEAEVRFDDENAIGNFLPVAADPFVGRIGGSFRF
jgi:outer membrane protein W